MSPLVFFLRFAAMDPTRTLDELSHLPGLPDRLTESEASANDLEDHGGDGGMQRGRYRRRRRRSGEVVSDDFDDLPVGSDPAPTPLEQELDRMVTTRPDDDTASYRRSRGVHHYRTQDPQTTSYYRQQEKQTDGELGTDSRIRRRSALPSAEADAVQHDDEADTDLDLAASDATPIEPDAAGALERRPPAEDAER